MEFVRLAVACAGRLEDLSLEQRERAICYLLEKLHTFQSSKQQRLLGLNRGFEQALVRAQSPWAGYPPSWPGRRIEPSP